VLAPKQKLVLRQFVIHQALASTRSLVGVIDEMTEEEVLNVLTTECASLRRHIMIDRLIAKAAELNSATYVANLKEQLAWQK